MTYLPPIDRTAAPDAVFQQPRQLVVVLRCTVCKHKVAAFWSDGELDWWSNDHHIACGDFDFDSVKGRVGIKRRAYKRDRKQQGAVEITPLPHSA